MATNSGSFYFNTGDKETVDKLDNLFMETPIGSIQTAIGDSFYGVNHRLMPNAIPINKDHYGLTFFTRPAMNMSTINLRQVRQMLPLLTTDTQTVPRIIRLLFDNKIYKADYGNGSPNGGGLSSPFVDNQQAFIPILTNTLLSISGWPDVETPMYNSAEGVYKESFSFVDGVVDNYSTYTIQASFRNIIGDPITTLFLFWLRYMSYVYQGLMMPYYDYIIENEIDYQTRIYRLVLDVHRNKITKIGACGAAFPHAISIGGSFNYESDKPINNSNDQISVPFKCMGAMYQDEILIYEFNKTVEYFNNAMKDDVRNNYYVNIPKELLVLFNHKGYPRINPNTYELEWWVSKENYNLLIQGK